MQLKQQLVLGTSTFLFAIVLFSSLNNNFVQGTTILLHSTPREAQNCDSRFPSWYFGATSQQCMQCYSYSGQDKPCHSCNGDTCSTSCKGGYSTYQNTITYQKQTNDVGTAAIVTLKQNYCRQCQTSDNAGEDGQTCCFMIDSTTDASNIADPTIGYSSTLNQSYGSMWNDCRALGNQYVDANGLQIYAKQGNTQFWGSMCHFIANCQTQDKYGRCMICMDGYTIDENANCVDCSNQNWDASNSNFVYQPIISIDTGTPIVPTQQSKQLTFPNSDVTLSNQNYADVTPTKIKTCGKCNGPNECTQCLPGYYLATNFKREVFDRNIAKSASFCRPCAPGCVCSDASNVCTGCEGNPNNALQGGPWYYNPDKQECAPCRTTNIPSGVDLNGSEGFIKSPLNYCGSCEWNSNLKKAVCTKCMDRSDDQQFNVITVVDTITVYSSNEDGGQATQNETAVDLKFCLPCNQVYSSSTQRITVPIELQPDNNTDFSRYQVKYTTNNSIQSSTTAGNSYKEQNFKQIIFVNYDATELNGSTASQGCTECAQPVAVKGTECDDDPCTTPRQNQAGALSNEMVYYIGCQECANGYSKDAVMEFWLQGFYNGVPRFWYMPEITICQRCQFGLKQQDIWKSRLMSGNTTDQKYKDFTSYRQDAVRRCTSTVGWPQFTQYSITQCGSYNNAADYLASTASINDSITRGPAYFSSSSVGTYASTISSTKSVGTFFGGVSTSPTNLLNYFLVNIANSNENSILKNVCVPNLTKNSCKVIRDITTTKTLTTIGRDQLQSSLTDARCLECFPNFVLTETQNCLECPIDGGSNSQTKYKGCGRCGPVVTTTTQNLSDKIQCVECLNGRQCSSQTLAADTTINYFYNSAATGDQKCFPCQKGCLQCNGVDGQCTQPQNFFRMVTPATTTQQKFEQCTVDFCIQCTDGSDICDKCQSGYQVITFQDPPTTNPDGSSTPSTKIYYQCAKCEQYCLECKPDTENTPFALQTCLTCDKTQSYMDVTNVCRKARNNCIAWKYTGGECTTCQQGYRLINGWCEMCYDSAGGYYYCPSQCQQGNIPDSAVNCRNSVTKAADDKNIPSTPEPTSRILQLLDEFDAQN